MLPANGTKGRKVMKKIVVIVLALLALVFAFSTTAVWAKSEKTTVLRLAGAFPPQDPVGKAMKALADRFNQNTDDRYLIEVHYSESLIKSIESLDAVRTGAVEMSIFPVGMFASVDRRFATAELPFLVNNVEGDAAMQVEMMPLYNQFMEKKFRCKAISSFTCMALDVCSTKPVLTADDWKGLLVQSVSPQSGKFIDYMKGAAVAMPWTEGYQALQKGVVEATMQSSSMMIMYKLYEVSKYVTRGYMIPASIMIVINIDSFKKMPTDLQEVLLEAGAWESEQFNDLMIRKDDENVRTLQEKGLTVTDLTKEERDKWEQMIKPYSNSLFEKMPDDFAKQVKEIAAKVNAKYPY